MKKHTLLLALAFSLPACGDHRPAVAISKGPYLQNATTSGITVCWVTAGECVGSVSWQPASGGGPEKCVSESRAVRYHKVRISGMTPYTQYAYSIGIKGGDSAGSTFRTAAAPFQGFKFAAYGDNRTQPAVHKAVLARMMEFAPDFVIQTGDLVANGEMENQWDEFWEVVRPLVRNTPYYPALGNHERGGSPYYRYFDVKREYGFDYGNAHFIALDTNRPESEHRDQERWLRKELATHQDATWRIVFFHHTPFTCVAMEDRRKAAVRLRSRLEPIFREGKVQLVVCGHDHNYQHHLSNGIHYVVTGGGGAPLYEIRPDTPNLVKAKKAHHFCEIQVDGTSMSIRAVEPSGAVIEEFDLSAERPPDEGRPFSSAH